MKRLTEIAIIITLLVSVMFVYMTILMMLIVTNDVFFREGITKVFLMIYLIMMLFLVVLWLVTIGLTLSIAEKERCSG